MFTSLPFLLVSRMFWNGIYCLISYFDGGVSFAQMYPVFFLWLLICHRPCLILLAGNCRLFLLCKLTMRFAFKNKIVDFVLCGPLTNFTPCKEYLYLGKIDPFAHWFTTTVSLYFGRIEMAINKGKHLLDSRKILIVSLPEWSPSGPFFQSRV